MQRLLAYIFPIALTLLASCTSSPAHRDRINCETIRPGMPEAKVNTIMGAAKHRIEMPMEIVKVKTIKLSYGEESGASGPVSIWLENSGAGYKVVETMCDGGA